MKKFLVFLICGIISGATFAQEQISKSGWYLQALVGANNTGTDNMSLGTLRRNIGVIGSLEGGYLFNPYLSMGLQVQYDRLHTESEEGKRCGFNVLEPSLNLYWDLTNTFLGYIPNRKNHVRLYAGGAAAFTSKLPGGYSFSPKSNNQTVLGYRAGLQYERNLGKSWAFMADASMNSFNDKLETIVKKNNDTHINIQVGIRKYFGFGRAKGILTRPILDTIYNEIIKRERVEIERVKQIPGPKAVYSIFFNIDKIDIRPTEVSKIQAVASFLKEHPEKVVFIFGYADRNTGTTQRNDWLARNRARVICEQLVNTYGIDPARIISHDQGDKVQPFIEEEYEKNRSTICVITDLTR